MKRRVLTLLLLGTAFLWLALSYLPPDVLPWRVTADARLLPFFRMALVGSALLFVVIQIVLIAAVFRLPRRLSRRGSGSSAESLQSFEEREEIHIDRRWEFLWTAIPLVGAICLFVFSYCALNR